MEDLYAILGVSNFATSIAIKTAYRTLAIQCHPDKNLGFEARERFLKLAEAYEVLSDRKKRYLYDQYREDGIMGAGEEARNSWFQGDPRATFSELYGSPDPYSVFIADGFVFRSSRFRAQEYDVLVTLHEVDSGCRKLVKTRRIAMTNGVPHRERRKRCVKVKPGTKDGTRIKLKRAGNHTPGREPLDIVFIVHVMRHSVFKRNGAHLKYTAHITVKQALIGCVLEVPTLNGDKIIIDTHGMVINPDTVQRIAGLGLPYYKQPDRRGDLIIYFKIIFPQELPDGTMEQLMETMPE